MFDEDDLSLATAVACLNAAGLSIPDCRHYFAKREDGAGAAQAQIDLLGQHRRRLRSELAALRLRDRYRGLKVECWPAAAGDDRRRAALSKQGQAVAEKLGKQRRRAS